MGGYVYGEGRLTSHVKKGIGFIKYPIVSMYGIFSYIYHKNQPNVGIYIIPYMDPMGYVFCSHLRIQNLGREPLNVKQKWLILVAKRCWSSLYKPGSWGFWIRIYFSKRQGAHLVEKS